MSDYKISEWKEVKTVEEMVKFLQDQDGKMECRYLVRTVREMRKGRSSIQFKEPEVY